MAGLASVVSATVSQGEAPSITRSKRDRMGRTPGLNTSTYIVRTGCQVQLNLGMHVVGRASANTCRTCMYACAPTRPCMSSSSCCCLASKQHR